MSAESLKLTTYFGERDQTEAGLLANELFGLYGRRELQTSALLRGIEGFGVKHSTHTDMLLSFSEDLPLVSVAVDTRTRIEAVLPEVLAIKRRGVVTLERARLLVGGEDWANATAGLPEELQAQAKLTVYLGRGQQIAGRPAFVAVCEALRNHGIHGATVLLGVDGTRHGARTRARLFSRNGDVPVMVISVGSGEAVAAALGELQQTLSAPIATLERVQVCRRDGVKLMQPVAREPEMPASSGQWWQKLTVHSSEADRLDGHPLHRRLVRRLREERVAGATSLRGIWGFHGDGAPHGDRLLQIQRHTPVMTIVVDTPDRIEAVFPLIEELTAERGLVTLESVPTFVQAAEPRR